MKLAFSTLLCMDYTYNELFKLCNKYGLGGVEVRTNPDNSFVYGNNLKITDIASNICIREYSETQLENAKYILTEMEKQNILGMRVFLGNFQRRYDVPKKTVDHDGIVKMLREMCDFSEREIWVETHNEYSTGKILSKLIMDVNRDNLKIIWDIMHPIEDEESPYDTLKYLGKRIAHVHIKDGIKRKDPIWHDFEYTPIGKGTLPIKEIINLLQKDGYDGFYSLEWESAWRDELKALDLSVNEVLEQYVNYMNN